MALAGSLEIEIVTGIVRLQREMAQANQTITGFGNHVTRVLSGDTRALAALGVDISCVSFTRFIQSSIDAMDALDKMSQRTGVAVETLSGLRVIAKESDSSMEDVSKTIQKLSKNMLEFARDGGSKTG